MATKVSEVKRNLELALAHRYHVFLEEQAIQGAIQISFNKGPEDKVKVIGNRLVIPLTIISYILPFQE